MGRLFSLHGLLSSLELLSVLLGCLPVDCLLGSQLFLLHLISDSLSLLLLLLGLDGHEDVEVLVLSIFRVNSLFGRVGQDSLLVLILLAWEENDLILVSLDSSHVLIELLLVGVGTSVVNRDADSSGELGSEASTSHLLKSEASAIALLGLVLESATSDNRSESLERSGEDALGFGLSAVLSSLLLGWLLEPVLDSGHPVLSEVNFGNGVVVLDHDDQI